MAKIRRIVLFLIFAVAIVSGQATAITGHTQNVKDDLGFLSTEELKDVQELIEAASGQLGLDMVVVITDDTQGKTSMDFADDYYDYGGFGIGDDYSGLLMLVNMAERGVWISTSGKAIDIFSDDRISNMTDRIAAFLSKGSYYDACREFVGQVQTYAGKGVPQGHKRVDVELPDGSYTAPIEQPNTYLNRVVRLISSPVVYVLALVISIVVTAIFSFSQKGKVTINKGTYEGEGSFQLTSSIDDYIRQTITRVRVTGSSSGGGSRSSVHRGSSGRSHGGGGRKF